jgi:hypothetical protein
MYKEFYGFTAYPFAPTPDLQFLYSEVIEEFWGPYYQHFRGGVCEINQHAAS